MQRRFTSFSTRTLALALLLGALLLLGSSIPAQAGLPPTGVTFSKSFAPPTIGPGSVSTLRFEITNENPEPVTELAFTDTLPAALTIAAPAFLSNGCGGTLTAPEGGDTITLSDGGVGAGSSCQITVDVTGTTPGSHQNVSGDLTSIAGNSGPAVATLTIAADRPGFSKSFSPDSVQLGGITTLTFTIDNTANGGLESGLAFTDDLPLGLEIANPTNLSNTCNGVVSAPSGGTTITLTGGSVPANGSCTIDLDVRATAVGRLDNRTSDLTFLVFPNTFSSGKASASLTVVADELALVKTFVDDPVLPGDTVVLELSLTNLNRSGTVTGITFTDDLDATLSGLQAVPPLPTDPCGAGSTLTGTSLLTLSGGTLAPGENCTFQATLQVPGGAPTGNFPNTTSSVTGTGPSGPVVGSAANDTLTVAVFPVLTKTFLDNPVGAGGTTELEFTITNPSTTDTATNISFQDTFDAVLVDANSAPAVFCNTGTAIFIPLLPPSGPGDSTDPARLIVSGGSLGPGASCTYNLVLEVDPGAPTGNYPNTTTEISATMGEEDVSGPSAEDDLDVVGAPRLNKEFTDDPADPGGTVILEFTLTHDEFAPADATAISFTDNLDAALSGLVATGLPQTDVCGTGSSISGTNSLSFTGGALAPGESCTFSVTLQVPLNAAPGFHTNTTSAVTATVDGLATTGNAATDDLLISGVELTKEFVGDPVLPGSTVILRFTITNENPDFEATGISFTDDLAAALPGLSATGLPQADICGTGSSISGTTNLTFSGGNLAAGTFCTFDVTLQVPAGAASATYPNVTSPVVGTMDEQVIEFGNARDNLVVDAELLDLAKSFTDDPAAPGGTVNLQFTIVNVSTTETITAITFTDDLDAALTGLASESGTQTDVCGAGSQLAGTSVLSLTGGSLAPGASCTFGATLRLPAVVSGSGPFVNTTSVPTGSAGGLAVEGAPATDELLVDQVDLEKAFDGPGAAGGTVTLTFTLTNQSASTSTTDLSFQDDLDAVLPGLVATGLPANGICGFGSQITGMSTIAFSGGSLAPGDSCTFDVNLQVPANAAPGSYPNSTTALLSSGLSIGAPATDTLEIEPPPAFSKLFDPVAIAVGGVSTLTFTIDNSASTLAATALDFSDDLPAGVVVAATPGTSTTCGGTVTATPGAGIVAFTGGSVAAGGSCTVQVDVTGSTEGTFVNTSGELTSSSGSSGTATDTLDIVAGGFVATKSFQTAPVLPGGQVQMELSIVNGSAFPLTDIALSDDLGAVLPGLAAEGLPQTDVCGAGSQLNGTSVISLAGGNLPPGDSCTIAVPVRAPAGAPTGTFGNTTSLVTGVREGVSVEADPATADLTVAFLDFTKSFSPDSVVAGSTTQLTFQITNPDPVNEIADLTFTDDLGVLFSGLAATDTPLSDVCGAGSLLSGDGVLTLTGGSLGPGESCSFSVTVAVPASGGGGEIENVTSVVSGAVDGTSVRGEPGSGASAPLTILGTLEIPTLSGWMLAMLALLLAAVGVRFVRP